MFHDPPVVLGLERTYIDVRSVWTPWFGVSRAIRGASSRLVLALISDRRGRLCKAAID